MEIIGTFLNSQPFIALFLVIGLGYAVGKISISGFSLGIGAVLFVGLGIGIIAPKSAPPGLLGTIGLILFLYGIGIQHGKNFFKGLTSPLGIKANLLAAIAVLVGFGATFLLAKALGFSHDFAAGMFAGSLTSTATLQAALGVAGTMNPSVGYATAYPFGVFGPILFFYLTHKWFKPKVEVPPPSRMVTAEIQAGSYQFGGKSVSQVTDNAPKDLDLLLIRRDGVNILPEPNFIFKDDDVLLIAGVPESIGSLKSNSPEVVRSDRSNFDYIRVFVSKAGFVGKKLKDIAMPKGTSARIIQIRRGDIDLITRPDLIIEYGDQLGVLVEPEKRSELSHFFGDSIQAESSFSFVSLGLGLVVGALVGLIPIPIPGVGVVKFGLAGGVLIMSLVFGYFGRLGPFNWNMPIVANVILRNLGLTLFLASVGISSGAPFVSNLAGVGLSLLLGGVVVVSSVVLTIILVGYFILGMKYDDLLGIASGATGNPAILAYASQLTPTGRPDIWYAMIFPGVGTIMKIILVQIMFALSSSPPPL